MTKRIGPAILARFPPSAVKQFWWAIEYAEKHNTNVLELDLRSIARSTGVSLTQTWRNFNRFDRCHLIAWVNRGPGRGNRSRFIILWKPERQPSGLLRALRRLLSKRDNVPPSPLPPLTPPPREVSRGKSLRFLAGRAREAMRRKGASPAQTRETIKALLRVANLHLDKRNLRLGWRFTFWSRLALDLIERWSLEKLQDLRSLYRALWELGVDEWRVNQAERFEEKMRDLCRLLWAVGIRGEDFKRAVAAVLRHPITLVSVLLVSTAPLEFYLGTRERRSPERRISFCTQVILDDLRALNLPSWWRMKKFADYAYLYA